VGSSGPRVHEETHLNRAQFIKMSFESMIITHVQKLTDLAIGCKKPCCTGPVNVVLHHVDLSNVATRHKEAPTGQKMSRCCSTFCACVAPFFVAILVRPNKLNIAKSASEAY